FCFILYFLFFFFFFFFFSSRRRHTRLQGDWSSDVCSSDLNLSVIEGLTVRSRTSSFAMKGKQRNVREAGQLLQADYVLEGSVLRAGQHFRINSQLIRTRDDSPVWTGRYDRELTDALAIQDEISRGIVNS